MASPLNHDEQSDAGQALLSQLFGGEGSGEGVTGQLHDILQHMLVIYSSAFLVLAGFIIFFHIVFAVAETAQTGKFMGGRMDPVWGPMRMVLVIGLLVPLGGMNSGQYGIMYLAKWGSGIAAKLWQETQDQADFLKPILIFPKPPSALPLVQALVIRDICEIYTTRLAQQIEEQKAKQAKEGQAQPNAPVQKSVIQSVKAQLIKSNADGSKTQSYGWSDRPYFCGAITYLESDEDKKINPYFTIEKAHYDAYLYLDRTLETTAVDYVAQIAGQANPSIGSLQRVADHYEEIVQEALDEQYQQILLSKVAAMRTQAMSTGWMSAPRVLSDLMQLNTGILAAISSLPLVDAPEVLLDPPMPPVGKKSIEETAEYYIYSALDHVRSSWEETAPVTLNAGHGLSDFTHALEYTISYARTIGEEGNTAHKIRALREMMPHDFFDITALQKDSPLVSLPKIGLYLQSKALQLLASAGVMRDIGDISSPFSMVLCGFGWIAYAVSFIIMLLLPLIPLVRFMIGVLTWMLQVVEGVISLPLIALAHLRMSDHGLINQSALWGYVLILKIVLRPPLMIMGFVGGLIIFLIVLGLINPLFVFFLALTTSSGQFAALWSLALWILYGLMALAVANACFKLIDVLPEKVLIWAAFIPSAFNKPPSAASIPVNN